MVAVSGMAVTAGVMGWRRHQADPARVFLQADQAYRAGQLVEADAALERLEQIRTPTSIDRYLRAQVDIGLKRDPRALVELAAIPDDDPLAPLARLRTGQIEIRLGRTRPAEAAFLAALKLLPRAVQPHKELVYIYNIQHRQAELDAQLLALVDLNAIDFQIVLHWTKTRNTNWKPAGDLPALQKFVAADPDDLKSQLALVDAYYRLNRLDEAERILEKIPGSNADARAKRIAIAMDRGEYAAAESLLDEGDCQTAELRGSAPSSPSNTAMAARPFAISASHSRPIRLTASLFRGWAPHSVRRASRKPLSPTSRRPRVTTSSGGWSPARRRLMAKMIRRCPTNWAWLAPRRAACKRRCAWLKLAIERNPLDSESQRMLFELERASFLRDTKKQESVTATGDRSSFVSRSLAGAALSRRIVTKPASGD